MTGTRTGSTDFSDPALVRKTMDYILGPEVRSQDTETARCVASQEY